MSYLIHIHVVFWFFIRHILYTLAKLKIAYCSKTGTEGFVIKDIYILQILV